VLATAKHLSTRAIEKLVAELAPQPDVPSRVRKLPQRHAAAPAPAEPASAEAASVTGSVSMEARAARPPAPAPAQHAPASRPPRAPDPTPLSPRRYKLEVTLDQQAHDQLRELQDLLANQIPNGDPALIVKRALGALLAETRKKKTAQTDKPRKPNTPRGMSTRSSRAVPPVLKRAVWQRDGGRCGFIGEDGRRCGATRALEFAHLHPWAKGGAHSLENLGLRCRAHNAHEANRDYGARLMKERRGQGSGAHRVREPVALAWGGRMARERAYPTNRDSMPTSRPPSASTAGQA
jgi:5-methylcytosine-specific restriction endonuclease McrA